MKAAVGRAHAKVQRLRDVEQSLMGTVDGLQGDLDDLQAAHQRLQNEHAALQQVASRTAATNHSLRAARRRLQGQTPSFQLKRALWGGMGAWGAKPQVPCDTRWASYISSTVSMLRIWAHARDAVSQLLERQKDRSPPWAVTLSQLLQSHVCTHIRGKLAAAAPPQQQLTPAGTTPELAVPAGAPPQQQQQLAAASTSRKREAPAANKSRAAKQGATHNSVAKRASAARLACGEIA
ncbi:hypothetical protein QJQ45_007027 [Haematococcus lacustris]|nr:hypothetical protein QJQ45_007027 [Haematococcus lacustris]